MTVILKFSDKTIYQTDSRAELKVNQKLENITVGMSSKIRQLAILTSSTRYPSTQSIQNNSDLDRVHLITSNAVDDVFWTEDVFFYKTSGYLKIVKKFNRPDTKYEMFAEGFCK
jgi:hypothetical protein